jgi:D-sedoheptulose 7-phosphate isomerase
MGAGQPLLTAIAKDPGRETLSERRILGFGRGGDRSVGMSTPGHASNIIRSLMAARDRGLRIKGPTSRGGGAMATHCDICLNAPSALTPLMQRAHVAGVPFASGLGEASFSGAAAGKAAAALGA